MLERLKDLFRPGAGEAKSAQPRGAPERAAAFKAEGDAFLAAGQHAEAIGAFRAAIDADPSETAALAPLGYALREQGQLDAAIDVLRTLVARDPRSLDGHYLLGLAHEGAGRPAEAIRAFERVVELEPGVVEARVRLCLLHVQSSNIVAATAVVEAGIARQPEAVELHYLAGNLHLHRGELAAAIAAYDRALAADPVHPEAHYNRGVALQSANRPAEALASFDKALQGKGAYPAALAHRGGVLLQLDRPLDALTSFDAALALDPAKADVLNDRGAALARLGRRDDALASYDRAVERDPGLAAAWANRGKLLRELGRLDEALESFERALARSPGNAELLNDYGLVLRDLKRPGDALGAFDQAVQARPLFAAAISNRGLVLQELDRQEEALAEYDRALAIDAALVDTHANRGNALQELERHEDALASYGRAFELRPDYEAAYFNESLSRLVLGDLLGGWPRYEWRWQASAAVPPSQQIAQPMWTGQEPLAGKTILVYAEQGLGDTLQFCRYARTLRERGATVLLQVQPPLLPLLEGLAGVARLLSTAEAPPPFDFHCPLLSLPLALGTTLETIPSGDAYLRPSSPRFAERLDAWQARLGAKGKPRVGLVWSGNPQHKNDRNRSIPLERFAGLVTPAARFVSLQNELRDADAVVLRARGDVEWFGAELVDFAETAALVTQLDLVVSVDTSVAHLAAAMGKPVWLLLPLNPDWRWLLQREDSPWYPSMRLFRQTRRGEWGDVIDRVGQEIALRFR